jgi:hypothetical protein
MSPSPPVAALIAPQLLTVTQLLTVPELPMVTQQTVL